MQMDFRPHSQYVLITDDLEFGSKAATKGTIFLNDIEIRALKQTVDESKAEIQQLKAIVRKQQEMIDLLWICPEMPGTFEGEERFNAKYKK